LEQEIKKIFVHYFEEDLISESLYMRQCHELAKRVSESHSHNHYPLRLLDLESIKFEIENSKDIGKKSIIQG
jgi:hypothetical protein